MSIFVSKSKPIHSGFSHTGDECMSDKMTVVTGINVGKCWRASAMTSYDWLADVFQEHCFIGCSPSITWKFGYAGRLAGLNRWIINWQLAGFVWGEDGWMWVGRPIPGAGLLLLLLLGPALAGSQDLSAPAPMIDTVSGTRQPVQW